jgi:hypothetical protein
MKRISLVLISFCVCFVSLVSAQAQRRSEFTKFKLLAQAQEAKEPSPMV